MDLPSVNPTLAQIDYLVGELNRVTLNRPRELMEALELAQIRLGTTGRAVSLLQIATRKCQLLGIRRCPLDLDRVSGDATSVGLEYPDWHTVLKALAKLGVPIDRANLARQTWQMRTDDWRSCYYPPTTLFRQHCQLLRNLTTDEQRAAVGLPPISFPMVAVIDFSQPPPAAEEPHAPRLAPTGRILDYLLDLSIRAEAFGVKPIDYLQTLITGNAPLIGIRGAGSMVLISRNQGIAVVHASRDVREPYITALYLAG